MSLPTGPLPESIASKPITIVGAWMSGMMLALLLYEIGFRAITILERSDHPFDPKHSTFCNTGGLMHHLNFSGDLESFMKIVRSTIASLWVFPDDTIGHRRTTILVPKAEPGVWHGKSKNGAIPWQWEANSLDIYEALPQIVTTYRDTLSQWWWEVYGNPDDFYRELSEEEVREMYGNPPEGSDDWLWENGKFHAAFDVAQCHLRPDAMIDELSARIQARLWHGITMKTGIEVDKVQERADSGYEVLDRDGGVIETSYAVLACGYAWNTALDLPEDLHTTTHLKLKWLLLLKLKPGMKVPPVVMVRWNYGALLDVGDGVFALVSWEEFNLDDITAIGGDEGNRQEVRERLELWRNGDISAFSDYPSVQEWWERAQADIRRYLPLIDTHFDVIGPMFAPHNYPEGRDGASPDKASKTRDELIRTTEHGNGIAWVTLHTKASHAPQHVALLAHAVFKKLADGKHSYRLGIDEHDLPTSQNGTLDRWMRGPNAVLASELPAGHGGPVRSRKLVD